MKSICVGLMVFVVSVVAYVAKGGGAEETNCYSAPTNLAKVVEGDWQRQRHILTDAFIVENVEKDHASRDELEKRCDTDAFRLAVLMLPAPEHSAGGSSKRLR